MRAFQDGHYWVQRRANDQAEVAVHDAGTWRLHSGSELKTGELHRIGRRFEAPADAFEAELEQEGKLGV